MKKLFVALNIFAMIAVALMASSAQDYNLIAPFTCTLIMCSLWVWGGLLWRWSRSLRASENKA